jgi:hypothetical protein
MKAAILPPTIEPVGTATALTGTAVVDVNVDHRGARQRRCGPDWFDRHRTVAGERRSGRVNGDLAVDRAAVDGGPLFVLHDVQRAEAQPLQRPRQLIAAEAHGHLHGGGSGVVGGEGVEGGGAALDEG